MTEEMKTPPEGGDSNATENQPRTRKQDNDAGHEDNHNVTSMDEYTVSYDPDAIWYFLDRVFHVERPEGQEIFVQLDKNAPKGFGKIPENRITDRLRRTNAPLKGYFSTSTLGYTRDEETGTDLLRHTKAAFKQFHVVVLDDVGTKIDPEKIPADLVPSYVIESSEGNWQYGYVLDKPIDDYFEAQMLIDYFVDAGLTDPGGAMPVKKVRLPCGVNGKPGDQQMFPVRLCELNDVRYSPQQLLDIIGVADDWERVRLNAQDRKRLQKRIGSTAWMEQVFHYNPGTGVIDPVLEWLAKKGMVVQECQSDFMDIICPWADMHTDQDLRSRLAGYSPLGHGMFPHMRVFNCFHSHAEKKGHDIDAFLQWVVGQGGPEVPRTEYRPAEVTKYVLEKESGKVFDITAEGVPRLYKRETINATTPSVRLPGGGKIKPLSLWLTQPSSLAVDGMVFDATRRERMYRDENGTLLLNRFYMPDYETSLNIDMNHVRMFVDYLRYLIPDRMERHYFVGWLACKVQNPAFRGAAMVMIAQVEGTGRNTLMKMIARLFGIYNVESRSLDSLIKGNEFNDWRSKLFVHVDESLAVDDPRTARLAYNRMKEIVDPMQADVMINEKHQGRYLAKTATSFLFFSNHTDALYLNEGSRRFFIITNPVVVEEPEYFTDVHQWIEKDDWRAHVWAWLHQLNANPADFTRPPPETSGGKEMARATTTNATAILQTAVKVWPAALVPTAELRQLLSYFLNRGVPKDNDWIADRFAKEHLLSARNTPVGRIDRIKVQDKHRMLRLKKSDASVLVDGWAATQAKAEAKKAWEALAKGEFDWVAAINDQLTEDGYDF